MVIRHDFVGHNILSFGDASPRYGAPINNVIYRTADPTLKWIVNINGTNLFSSLNQIASRKNKYNSITEH